MVMCPPFIIYDPCAIVNSRVCTMAPSNGKFNPGRNTSIIPQKSNSRTTFYDTYRFHKLKLLSFLDFLKLAYIFQRQFIKVLPVLLHLDICLCESNRGWLNPRWWGVKLLTRGWQRYKPHDKYGPQPVFLHKVVLEHSHGYWLMYLPWPLSCCSSQMSSCNRDLPVYKNIKT